MRKSVCIALALVFFIGMPIFNDLYAQDPALDMMVARYFTALKAGDTATLRTMLSAQMLKRRGKLLTNPRYSSFLQWYYKDAEFQVAGITPISKNDVAVDIEVISGGQVSGTDQITFAIEKYKWKLYKDRRDLADEIRMHRKELRNRE